METLLAATTSFWPFPNFDQSANLNPQLGRHHPKLYIISTPYTKKELLSTGLDFFGRLYGSATITYISNPIEFDYISHY